MGIKKNCIFLISLKYKATTYSGKKKIKIGFKTKSNVIKREMSIKVFCGAFFQGVRKNSMAIQNIRLKENQVLGENA